MKTYEEQPYVEKKCSSCNEKKRIKENSFIQNVKNHNGRYICSSCAHTGLKKDLKTKRKISNALKGRTLSDKHKTNIQNAMSKTWRSDKTRYNKIIGIFRGRFDPPHNGHLSMALTALANAGINELWWSPINEDENLTSSDTRIQMIKSMIKPYKNFRCFNFEIKNNLDGNLKNFIEEIFKIRRYSRYGFYMMIGSDEVNKFQESEDFKWILENMRFWIYPKKGFDFNKSESLFKDPKHIYIKNCGVVNGISSSLIRQGTYNADIIELVPKNIIDIIEQSNLYKDS